MNVEQHNAYLFLAGKTVKEYRVQVDEVLIASGPHEIIGKLVDDSVRKKPAIPFVIDTYPKHLADPEKLTVILSELGKLSDGRVPIRVILA